LLMFHVKPTLSVLDDSPIVGPTPLSYVEVGLPTIDPEEIASRHATDAASGLTYLQPPGWKRRTEDLIEPFTCTISNDSGAMIGSGRWDHLLTAPPSNDELIAGAAWLASEYGEFFLPFEVNRVDVVMEETTVAGRPAARAGYRLVFHPEDGEPAYVRVLVISVAPDLVSFVLAVAPDSQARLVESVLASARPAG
jgi:hypothetical protein